MVQILHDGGQPVTISLEELNKKTPAQIIEEITNSAPDGNTYLTRCGVKFANNELLASRNLVENDFLHIVQMVCPSTSNNTPKMSPEEIDVLRRKLDEENKSSNRMFGRALETTISNFMIEPGFFEQTLQQFPELKDDPHALSYFADPLLILTILKDTPSNRRFCKENPSLITVIKSLVDKANNDRYGNIARRNAEIISPELRAIINRPLQPEPVAPAPPAPSGSNAISADFLQQAINFAMANANNPNARHQNIMNPLLPAPSARRAPEENPLEQARRDYAQQLQQMRECGFIDDELSLTVLMQCQGNVATAMEILIEDVNPM